MAVLSRVVATTNPKGINMTTEQTKLKPLFELGQIVGTPRVFELTNPIQRMIYLRRHQSGDWGCICKDDRAINNAAVKDGSRILSAYPIDPSKPAKGYGDNCLWIITEADRSTTTFLLPDEY